MQLVLFAVFFGLQETTGRLFTDNRFVISYRNVKTKSAVFGPNIFSARAYPGSNNIKQLGVFLLSPGWDVSPLQDHHPALNWPVPIYTPWWN